ncbi:MAG: TIGR00725 family protein [Solirubrobacteraceae bacterium]
MSRARPLIAVVGSWRPDPQRDAAAEAVGRGLAEAGAVVVCGGMSGVMEAACRGAAGAGGLTVGLLPGGDPGEGNAWVDVAIPTAMAELRNGLIARAGRAMIAIGGEWGTLSEVAFALKLGRPVVGLDTWELARGGRRVEGIVKARDPAAAVGLALEASGVSGAAEAQPG